jgi:hypothetical protein
MLQASDPNGAFTCLGQCGPGCGCGPCRRGFAGVTYPTVPVATYASIPKPSFAPVYHTPFAGAQWPSTLEPTRTRFAPMQDPRHGGVVQGLEEVDAAECYREQTGMIVGTALGGALTYDLLNRGVDPRWALLAPLAGLIAGKYIRRVF